MKDAAPSRPPLREVELLFHKLALAIAIVAGPPAKRGQGQPTQSWRSWAINSTRAPRRGPFEPIATPWEHATPRQGAFTIVDGGQPSGTGQSEAKNCANYSVG